MRRCLYCLEPLELVSEAITLTASCVRCGCEYTQEILDAIDDERWAKILNSSRYRIERIPGDPPSVVVHDLSVA